MGWSRESEIKPQSTTNCTNLACKEKHPVTYCVNADIKRCIIFINLFCPSPYHCSLLNHLSGSSPFYTFFNVLHHIIYSVLSISSILYCYLSFILFLAVSYIECVYSVLGRIIYFVLGPII